MTLRACLKSGGVPDWGRYFCRARWFDAGILADFKSNQRSVGGKRCTETAFRWILKLKIGPLGTTRMWCPDVDREARFVEAVESATHYEMDGPMLLLLSDGKLNAIFQARP